MLAPADIQLVRRKQASFKHLMKRVPVVSQLPKEARMNAGVLRMVWRQELLHLHLHFGLAAACASVATLSAVSWALVCALVIMVTSMKLEVMAMTAR